MSYTITVRVYQSKTDRFYNLVEKSVASGGTWSEVNGEHVLTMYTSGTCGTLRFKSDTGLNIVFAVGVHNYKRWCDIVGRLDNNASGTTIQAEYYNSGGRASQREKQTASHSGENENDGKVSIQYTVAEGNNLKAYILLA